MIVFSTNKIRLLGMTLTVCLLSTALALGGNGKGGGGTDISPPLDTAFRLTWLDTFRGTDSRARDINDMGVVVGESLTSSDEWRAFRAIPERLEAGALDYWYDGDNDEANDLMEDLNVIQVQGLRKKCSKQPSQTLESYGVPDASAPRVVRFLARHSASLDSLAFRS